MPAAAFAFASGQRTLREDFLRVGSSCIVRIATSVLASAMDPRRRQKALANDD
jgi:hypothetical protein